MWNIETGELVVEHPHDASARNHKLRFSPDGKAIAFCSDGLQIDNATGPGTGDRYFSRVDKGWYIKDFAFAPQGTLLAAVPQEGESYVFIYDLNTTRQGKTRQLADGATPITLPLPDAEKAIQIESRTTRIVNLSDGVEILEIKTKREDQEEPAHLGAFALSADGTHLIGSDYPSTYWWNVDDGTIAKTIDTVYSLLSLSHDGGTLLGYREEHSAPDDDKHQVHLIADGDESPRKIMVGAKAASLALSADGTQLAAGGDDAHLRLFDVASGEQQHRLLAAEGPVTFVSFSPDGKRLVTGGARHDSQPALWDLSANPPQPTYLQGHEETVRLGLFTPNGETLVTIDGGGKMILWNVNDPQQHIAMPVAEETLRFVTLDPDRQGFITIDKPYVLRNWALADLSAPASNGQVLRNNPERIRERHFVEFSGFAGAFDEISYASLRATTVSRDEKRIATSSDGNVSIWALDEMLAEIRGEDVGAARSFNRTWDLEGQYVIRRFPVCDKDDAIDLSGIAFSQDGSRVLTTFESKENGQIAIWDVATGKQVKSFPIECEYISVAASPTSDIVAVVPEYTNSLRLFDLKSAEELTGINTKGELDGACFDASGKYLVVAHRDIDVYELATRKKVRTIANKSGVVGVAVSPDGKQIFLGADVPEILDFQSGAALYKDNYSAAIAGGAAFSPDSQWAARHQMYNASEKPIFYNAAQQREISISLNGEDPYFTQAGDYVVLTDDDDVQFVHFASLTDDKLQQSLGELDVVDNWYWDGKYLVLRFPVRGRVTRAQLGQIEKIPAPVKLDLLGSAHLTQEDVALLAGAENLRGIALPHYCPAAVLQSLARCPNIEELTIYTPDEAVLAELGSFPNLRCLTLFRHSDAPAEAYRVLGQLSKLEDVAIDIQEEQGGVVLDALAKLSNLRSLRVEWPEATAADLEKIGQLPSLVRLSLADIDNLNTNDGLARLTNIRELQLQQREFNDEGLKLLQGLDNLQGLDVFGTGVTGADELLGFKNLKWLRNSYEGRKQNDLIKEKRPDLRLF